MHICDFINKGAWPPSSSDLNPLYYQVWGWMLEKYKCLNPQVKNISELKHYWKYKTNCHKTRSRSRSPAFASVCALPSTLTADTLNIHCKGLPFSQWYFLRVMTGVFSAFHTCRSLKFACKLVLMWFLFVQLRKSSFIHTFISPRR